MTIDFENLRATASFEDAANNSREIITTIPVRKPSKLDFFRVREGPEWTFTAYLLNLGEEGEKYLVAPECLGILQEYGLAKRVTLYTCISQNGTLFLSEINQPESGGKYSQYNESREEAYVMAQKGWVKIIPDRSLGAYRILKPSVELPEPVWPPQFKSIVEMLPIAFRDKVIDSADHPVVKRLAGEV